jgi:hypothetical protein
MANVGKILILGVLFSLLLVQGAAAGGIFDFLFGKPAEPAATPAPVVTSAVQTVATDFSGVITLLQSILASVTRIEQKMPPASSSVQTGNIMLYDNTGNIGANADQASAVVALPPGECTIGVYAQNRMYVTVEEMKDYTTTKYTRNLQTCVDSYLCRVVVRPDDQFPFIYIYFRDSDTTKALVDRVFLAYRCRAI